MSAAFLKALSRFTDSGLLSDRATQTNRGQFSRLQAPMFMRSAGSRVFADSYPGGQTARVRAYSDDALRVGRMLEIELLVGEAETLTVLAQVAWVDALPKGAAAAYDVGMELVPMSPQKYEKLKLILV